MPRTTSSRRESWRVETCPRGTTGAGRVRGGGARGGRAGYWARDGVDRAVADGSAHGAPCARRPLRRELGRAAGVRRHRSLGHVELRLASGPGGRMGSLRHRARGRGVRPRRRPASTVPAGRRAARGRHRRARRVGARGRRAWAPLARRGSGSPDRDRRCVVRSRLGRAAGEPRPGHGRPARPGRARAGPVARLRPRHVGAEPRGPLGQRRDPRDRPLLGAGGGRPRARPVAAAGGAASRRSPVRGRVRRDRRRVPRNRVLRLARCRGRVLSGMVVRRDRLGARPRPRRPRTALPLAVAR